MGRHRSGARATATAPSPRLYAIEMVDAGTGAAHWVTDEAVAAGRLGGDGRYAAMCGRLVLAASLTDPGVGPCRSCMSIPAQRARTSR